MGGAEFGVYGMCQRLSRTLMRGLGRASGSGRCGLGVNHRFFGRIDIIGLLFLIFMKAHKQKGAYLTGVCIISATFGRVWMDSNSGL